MCCFFPFWKTLTNNYNILQYILGVNIPFVAEIEQVSQPVLIKCSNKEKIKIDASIVRFMESGIIEVEHCPGEYVNCIFPVTKKNGDLRIVLNLKPLNPSIEYEHFKMEHLNSAVTLISEKCCMVSIDLKDSLFSKYSRVSS